MSSENPNVPAPEVERSSVHEALAESEARNRLNNLVAVTVAILSMFMAITKVKDDNIVQAMLQAKSDAVDTWGQYQSKRIKHHLIELGRDQSIAIRPLATDQNGQRIDTQIKRYETDI